MNAKKHIETIEGWIGKNTIDCVLMNNTPLPKETVEVYSLSGEKPVRDDLKGRHSYKVIRGDFLSSAPVKKNHADSLTRSLIRHDSDKIAAELFELTKKK